MKVKFLVASFESLYFGVVRFCISLFFVLCGRRKRKNQQNSRLLLISQKVYSLTLYIGGGAANHGKNPIEMALAVISQTELYTPPDYGDDHNDHINVERGIELYRTLHPSIPKNSLYFAWDRGGLYVFSETLMVALRRKLGKDDEETNKRLVSDFTNYLRMLGIVK